MDEVKQTGKAERDFNYSIWYSTPSWSWTGIIRFSCGSENLFYLSYLCLMSQQSQKWICEFVMDCFYMQNIKKKSVFQEKMWSCDIVNPPMIPALIVPAWLNKGETLVSKAMCGVGVYCVQHRWEHYIMKNMFSLVSTYISWSSLSLDKWFLRGLCSPPTGKPALLQAVQIQLLSLRNKRSHLHRQASSARW